MLTIGKGGGEEEEGQAQGGAECRRQVGVAAGREEELGSQFRPPAEVVVVGADVC